MHTCTFFGHKDTPDWAVVPLKNTIISLIEQKNVSCFYVGNQGKYDRMVMRTLQELQEKYPHISFYVVLAYLPTEKEQDITKTYKTLFPEGLEKTPPRFSIDKRNHWMLQNTDYVVSYVAHITGGAAKFTDIAIKKGKHVINLAKTQ